MHGNHDRFGSAEIADVASVRAAGLLGPRGMPVGQIGDEDVRVDSPAPLITIGGSGTGKSLMIANAIALSTDSRLLVLDPRAELACTVGHNFARSRANLWTYNPQGLLGLVSHRTNPLDVLSIEVPSLATDCNAIVNGLIPASTGGSDGRFFELTAQSVVWAVLMSLAERDSVPTFRGLYDIINAVESDPELWHAHARFMLASRFDGVRRIAGVMITRQDEAPKEFGGVMGEVYAHLRFLDDEQTLRSTDDPHFSLSSLTDADALHSVFLIMSLEQIEAAKGLLRVIMIAVRIYKSRKPHSPPVTLIVDEAGLLGGFHDLLRMMTYGRGMGLRTWPIFQSIGQIERNFGAPAVQDFIGSAQVRQFLPIRSLETANLVSRMLGQQTLHHDDTVRQEEARRGRMGALRRAMDGGDIASAMFEFEHYSRLGELRASQPRMLLSADELLAMPKDAQIIFIGEMDLRPLIASKAPMFTRPRMNGRWLPNGCLDMPQDRVLLPGRFGPRWARVITEHAIPPELAHFAPYKDGAPFRYVEGYRPL